MAKDINYSKDVGYSTESDNYVVRMEQRKFRWWWLLLLLPLLLLIKCNKTIEVRCYDSETNATLVGQDVTFQYDTIVKVKSTDANGIAVFDSLRTSVFGYVFLFWKQCKFVASSDCYASDTAVVNFHYTRRVDLPMLPRRVDLYIKLLDKETGDILPDGIINYKYTENGEQKTGKAKADASGIVKIKNMRLCSKIDLIAQCDGYEDTERLQTPCKDNLVPDDANAMRLKPIKDKFTFFVKNKETKEPIADASCTVVLTNPNGRERERRQVSTSVDGKGIAVFSDAFIRATVAIDAVKRNFKPGKLEGGPFTVEEFKTQPDDVRTIWLEPEPFVVEFKVEDCTTGAALAGAKIKIKIIDTKGNVVEEIEEISNRNGIFPIKAKEGYKIIIDISYPPLYKPRHYEIDKFGENIDKTICLDPEIVEFVFRTVAGGSSNSLVPDCNLVITSSKKGNIPPNNSGTGEFKVSMQKDEFISITASKQGYLTNSTKIRNAGYSYLSASQSNRDIPMSYIFRFDRAFPGGESNHNESNCYDLPSAPISFAFKWHLCTVCTTITIKDDNGNVITTLGYQTNRNQQDGTIRLTSPTKRICVFVNDNNGCNFDYHISQ